MKQRYVIGIDISKSKIDCALMNTDKELLKENVVINTESKIKSYLRGIVRNLNIDQSKLLVCCENTGIYNRPLARVCDELGIPLWIEHALKIKRASIDMRGKTDQQDAKRIAEYGVRYQDRKVLYNEPSKSVFELNKLIKIRETIIAQKVMLKNQLREAKTHDKQEYTILKSGYTSLLHTFEKNILKIDEKIKVLIQKEEDIKQNVELMTSITGIGIQTAVNLIVATDNFKSFHSAKHLACYAGVVPFQNESGTIIKKSRVSKMANKNLKKLLHLAAMTASRYDEELKAYYIRKVKEGKNKMSVLNAIRNKLVHRIMAVVTRKTPFLSEKEFFYQKKKQEVCFLT